MKRVSSLLISVSFLVLFVGACTTVIQEIDEHDSKARYRRGKAYLLLGMTKSAKDDFMFILKSPYSTNEGVHAARLGLQELRSIVNKNEIEAKRTLHRGISGCLFSQGRNTSKETDNLNIAADRESEKYEEDKPQLQSHLLHAADEHAEEFRLPPSKATEHTFNEKIKQRNPKRLIYEDEDISDQATTPEAETVHTPHHCTHHQCMFMHINILLINNQVI